jgi:hypothetical protein
MQVDMMLADYATVHQGKLFITGAGINLILVPPTEPYLVNFGVGITVAVPWTATNQNHRIKIALVDNDEQNIPIAQVPPGVSVPEGEEGMIHGNINVGRSPSMEVGEDSIVPLAFQFPSLPLPHPGAYKLTMQIDGTDVASIRFRIVAPQPMSFGGPSTHPTN